VINLDNFNIMMIWYDYFCYYF